VGPSARLFRAFRTEQAAPAAYYTSLARDTVGSSASTRAQMAGSWPSRWGPGFFIRELRGAGARAVCVDTSSGELAALGRPEAGSAVGTALRVPLASGAVDVCFSSNSEPGGESEADTNRALLPPGPCPA
jgi:hypothetical protein